MAQVWSHYVHKLWKLLSVETACTAAILQDLLWLSFFYPFKKLLKYYDTSAYAAAAYFRYQMNRSVRDFSRYQDNSDLAHRISLPGQETIEWTNEGTYQSPLSRIIRLSSGTIQRKHSDAATKMKTSYLLKAGPVWNKRMIYDGTHIYNNFWPAFLTYLNYSTPNNGDCSSFFHFFAG